MAGNSTETAVSLNKAEPLDVVTEDTRLPEPVGDADGDHQQQPEGDEGGEGRRERPERTPASKVVPGPTRADVKRDAIVEAMDRRREAQINGEDPDAPVAADDRQQDEPAPAARKPVEGQITRRSLADQRADDARPDASDGDDPEVSLTVDGVDVRMRLSEVRKRAQRDLAADNRLDKAKRIVQEAHGEAAEVRRDTSARTPASAQPGPAAPSRAQTKLEPAQLLDVVEAIQTGLPDEGAKKLADVINDLVYRQGVDRADVDEAVAASLADKAERDASGTAIRRFATNPKYADIVNDPHLSRIAVERTHDEMVEEFRQHGESEERLAYLARNPQAAAQQYVEMRKMRVNGQPKFPDLRSYDQIYEAAGEYTRAWATGERRTAPAGGKPQQAQQIAQVRADRKGGLNQQPRSAGARGGASRPGDRFQPAATAAAPDVQASRHSAVAEMRASRGAK